jgi:sigma-B regulation protein RsbU (phosphoserine phosphatase)
MAKILLVDDSEANRDMLARRLQRKGHEVLVASDGLQAVAMARTESPEVVLMDLNLPGLDGWSATRQIKDSPETRTIPVIALTAHAMSGDRQKALQAGCDDYDTKPVDFPRLLAKIEAFSRAPATPPPGAEAAPARPAPEAPAAAQPPARTQPRVDPARRHVAAERPSTAGPDAGHVLVVDDTEVNRDLAARLLRRAGFTVDTAADGARALERIANQSYDAVLLDVMMPGIDGLEVLRTLRTTHLPTDLPVVMATARDSSDDVVEALELGANDYVPKPLDLPVLLARLRTQVSVKRSVDRIRGLERSLAQRNAELEAANARMRDDLTAAAKVQEALLPTVGPPAPGYRFAWHFQPSAALGGDILNVFDLGAGRFGLYLLDVSGHGVAAALLSVTVSRFLSPVPDPSSILWRQDELDPNQTPADSAPRCPGFQLESPPAVATRLSRRFPFDGTTGQFFTMVYGILDADRHQFRYVSAGHPNLLQVSADGRAWAHEASGYPVGVGPGDYDEYASPLAPGDRVYLYSDGITEALSPDGELFGVPRMLEILAAGRSEPLDQSIRTLADRVRTWSGTGDRKDDQSVLAIERHL